LSNGLPALEKLHKTWSSRVKKDKYLAFEPALTAGLDKIEDYYNKTSLADAYTMTMSEYSVNYLPSVPSLTTIFMSS
jgi:hypothetical protein